MTTATLSADNFLPVAHEVWFVFAIDLWVIENAAVYGGQPGYMPAHRFAINLSPTSVCRARFPAEVKQLLTQYPGIEPRQLVLR